MKEQNRELMNPEESVGTRLAAIVIVVIVVFFLIINSLGCTHNVRPNNPIADVVGEADYVKATVQWTKEGPLPSGWEDNMFLSVAYFYADGNGQEYLRLAISSRCNLDKNVIVCETKLETARPIIGGCINSEGLSSIAEGLNVIGIEVRGEMVPIVDETTKGWHTNSEKCRNDFGKH